MAAPYQDLLDLQCRMNRQTFAHLQELGLGATDEVALDFFFDATDEPSAAALKRFLCTETDYRVETDVDDAGGWHVVGATTPTVLTLEILDQWVDWMITAGMRHGCVFDGWGTDAPGEAG